MKNYILSLRFNEDFKKIYEERNLLRTMFEEFVRQLEETELNPFIKVTNHQNLYSGNLNEQSAFESKNIYNLPSILNLNKEPLSLDMTREPNSSLQSTEDNINRWKKVLKWI